LIEGVPLLIDVPEKTDAKSMMLNISQMAEVKEDARRSEDPTLNAGGIGFA
jgi:hypothetical protein